LKNYWKTFLIETMEEQRQKAGEEKDFIEIRSAVRDNDLSS
jgi:hypothetical protein